MWGSLLADIIYLSAIKIEEQVEWDRIRIEVMREQPTKSACCFIVIGAVISVGVLGFWFGIGAALGAKMDNSLEELISR